METQRFDGLLRWRCIGPFRGGRVVAVTGSYHDQNTFYFGGVAGGVWKTTDAGQYWECVSDGFFTTSAVGALAVAPSDSNVIYAGTGETTIRIDVSHGDGVYKSTDAGVTWRNVGLKDTRYIGKIRVHPQNPDLVWVAALGHAFGPNAERGVFRSADGGQTWQHTLFVSEKAGAVDLSVAANPRILYASVWEAHRSFWQISSGGPDSGLYQSTDGGLTWANITGRHGLPSGTLGKIAVAASPARAGRVWALIEHTTQGGLYRSDDEGQTWERVSDNQHLLSRAWYYTHLTPDPVDPETVYVNNLAFHRSTDGGRTFAKIDTPHGDNHDVWVDPRDNRRMIQGNDGGANVSVNGGQTFSSIYNQPTAQFYHIAADSRSPYVVYGTQQDNSSIATPSSTPQYVIRWADSYVAGTGESGYIAVRPDNPDILYVGAIGSSPGGGNALQRYDHKTKQIRLITTWPEVASGVGAGEHKYRFAWTYPIIISPHDPDTLYIGGNLVFKSTNEGQTWLPISPDLTRADPETLKPTGGPVNKDAIGAETYATVFALIESPHARGVLWAGSDDGLIHRSADGGGSWQDVTPPDLAPFTMISCIEPSPFDADTVYVAATRYKHDDFAPMLFVTRDAGQSWQRIDAGIGALDFTRVVRADPERRGLLFCGTETGLYVSFDDGAHWERFQLNLPVSPIHDLIIKDGDLIAGTHGRSIWILDDLNPLRQGAADSVVAQSRLFQPRVTQRVLPGVDWTGDDPGYGYVQVFGTAFRGTKDADGALTRHYFDAGQSAPRGAIITYWLSAAPVDPLTLTFKDAQGNKVRSFSSRLPDDEAVAKELRAPARAGFNRLVWDLRHAPLPKIQGDDPPGEATFKGAFVPPGSYSVTLKVGEQEHTAELLVVKPPQLPASQADLDAQYALQRQISAQLERTIGYVNRMRDLRAQLDGWAKRAGEHAAIAEAAKELSKRVLAVEEELLVPGLRPGWADSLNRGTRLLEKLASLPDVVALGDYRPTDAAIAVYTDLTARIEAAIARYEALTRDEIPGFNAQVAGAKLGAVVP